MENDENAPAKAFCAMGGDAVEGVIDPDRIARALVAKGAEVAELEAGREAIQRFNESLAPVSSALT